MGQSHSDKSVLALVKRYETSPNDYLDAEEYDIICGHYTRMAQLKKALTASKQGLSLHQGYTPLYYHLAKTQMELGELEHAKDSIQTAVNRNKRLLEKSSKKLPQSVYLQIYESYLLKAEIHLKYKELGLATRAMQDAAKTPVHFRYSPYIDMAQLYNDANLPVQANKCCQKACQDTPNDAAAWNLLCHSYFQLNLPKKAIGALKKLVELEPYDAQHWCRLGIACTEFDEPIEAEKAFEYALSIDEELFDAWFHFALLHMDNQAYAKAFECLQHCDQLQPNQVPVQVNMAICERSLEQYEASLQRFTQLIKQCPDNADILTEMTSTLFFLEQWDTAIRTIKLAIRIEPSPTRWAWLSNLYLIVEEYDNSLQAMLETERMDPYFPFVDLHIAFIYQELGNSQQAFKHIQMAAEKDPNALRHFLKNDPVALHRFFEQYPMAKEYFNDIDDGLTE